MKLARLLMILLLGSIAVILAESDLGGCGPDTTVIAGSGCSIRRIAVLGERHSGTNFMARLLATNLDLRAYTFGDHFYQNRCDMHR